MKHAHPTHVIHRLAGAPAPAKKGCDPEPWDGRTCLVCGYAYPTVVPAKKAIPRTDTDGLNFRGVGSDVVCTACAWCSEGRPPDTLRMWSIVWRADGLEAPSTFVDYINEKMAEKDKWYSVAWLIDSPGLALVNRSDMTPLIDTLIDPPDSPWFACVADSGQIHTVRFARMNAGPRWTIRFEREDVSCHADDFAETLWRVACLRQAGFTHDEILSGRPEPRRLVDPEAFDAWTTHTEPLASWRGSAVLELASFFCTKDWTDAWKSRTETKLRDARPRVVAGGGDRSPLGVLGQHPAEEHPAPEVLGLGAEGGEGRSGQGGGLRSDGERDAQPAPDQPGVHQGVVQGDLFEAI